MLNSLKTERKLDASRHAFTIFARRFIHKWVFTPVVPFFFDVFGCSVASPEKNAIFADQFRGIMKQGIHPDNYRLVVFKDMSNDYAFLSKSAANTKETIQWEDGNEYPLIKVEVSHKSHPFYTGKAQFVDTAGRIDKFRQKYDKFKK